MIEWKPPTDWERGKVWVNGRYLTYQRTGGAKPPLLLAHGFTDSGFCWSNLALHLAADYDVVMPNAIGHATSDRVTAALSLSNMVDDLAALIHILGLEQPALLGHSMGAAVAALLAARHPALVLAVALEDPPWYATPRPRNPAAWRDWVNWLLALREKETAVVIAEQQALNPTWSPIDVATYVAARQQVDLALFDLLGWGENNQWRETVAAIQCPLLLITADVDKEALVTPEVAEEVVGLAKNGRFVHIPHAGHHICRTQFAPFLAALTDFFRQD